MQQSAEKAPLIPAGSAYASGSYNIAISGNLQESPITINVDLSSELVAIIERQSRTIEMLSEELLKIRGEIELKNKNG